MAEDAWKCNKHPTLSRRSGVCPTCLHDRLITLCPNCANSFPCTCVAADSTSRFSVDSACGVSGRIDAEASVQRSRSAADTFLRSRLTNRREETKSCVCNKRTGSTTSFWSGFGMIFGRKAKAWPWVIGRSSSSSLRKSSESEKAPKACDRN